MVALYALPTVPDVREAVVILKGGTGATDEMMIEPCCVESSPTATHAVADQQATLRSLNVVLGTPAVAQLAPPFVLVSIAPGSRPRLSRPTVTQSAVEWHETSYRLSSTDGEYDSSFQLVPPLDVVKTSFRLAAPTITQSLVEAHDTLARLVKKPGLVGTGSLVQLVPKVVVRRM
jgi:hypothetical protein